jgi:dTDP-4-amino-4,6-dideoxygalactose transaminase
MSEFIPLVDLRAQHRQIADAVEAGWRRVVERAAYVLGEEVAAFEDAFARFCGVHHCVGVGSGTDAIEMALRASGVGPGDEVIVPVNSFVSSATSVVRVGASPILVDVDDSTLLIDPDVAASHIRHRTKAIMPVHLYGQVAPVERLEGLGPLIVEDAAQSHGATRNGIGAGAFGAAAAVSFYPSKNLGAYGDAGAVLTNDDHVAQRVRSLRNLGSTGKHVHAEDGLNSRLDTLQAVVLSAKLEHLTEWNALRRSAAARYDELLADLDDVRLPVTAPGNEHVWHLYVVRVPRRDEVLAKLTEAGIGAGVHYPVPLHLQGALAYLGHHHGDFPVAEAAAGEVLSLPMFPEITGAQQERVAEALRKALR